MTEQLKRCQTCKTDKALELFSLNKKTPDGRGLRCKACDSVARKKWFRNNIEKARFQNKRNLLRYQYGMEIEEYEKACEKQNNVCGICGKPDKRRLHVDHDHTTNIIRGLLCNSCNRGLGFFKDSVDSLQNAVKYLTKGVSHGTKAYQR